MGFYTYMWLREDGTPYYIGKGEGGRGFTSKAHKIHRPKDDARILVQYWSDEETAFEMEKYYIRLFGRRDNGTGILRNLTDGGDGGFGHINQNGLNGARKGGKEAWKKLQVWLKDNPDHLTSIASLGGKERFLRHGTKGLTNGLHVRWHVNRNIKKLGCSHC